MHHDILDRLRTDPGTRTLGQLLQDREAAAHEIRKLRKEMEQLRTVRTAKTKDKESETIANTDRQSRAGALIRIADVAELVGVSRTTIYRWVSEGTFPPPVRIVRHAVRWKIDEIEEWRESL